MTQELRKTAIFLAALATLALLFWALVLRPIEDWKDREQAGLNAAQERSKDLAERLIVLRRDAAALSAATEFEGIWSASNAGQATARVQATLSEVARRNGLALRSIAPLRAEPLALKPSVAFRIEAEATLDQLVAFLRAAEYHAPLLIFEKGTIRRLSRPGPLSEQPLVFFQFDISAPYDLVEGN